MYKIIATNEIGKYTKEITDIPTTEYAHIEIHTTLKKLTIYNGTIWGIQQIKLNENGVLTAQVNDDPTAIILHGVRDVHITHSSKSTTLYTVNIEYRI